MRGQAMWQRGHPQPRLRFLRRRTRREGTRCTTSAGLPLGPRADPAARRARHEFEPVAAARGSESTAQTIPRSGSIARHPGGAPYRPPRARGRLARPFIQLSREGPNVAQPFFPLPAYRCHRGRLDPSGPRASGGLGWAERAARVDCDPAARDASTTTASAAKHAPTDARSYEDAHTHRDASADADLHTDSHQSARGLARGDPFRPGM